MTGKKQGKPRNQQSHRFLACYFPRDGSNAAGGLWRVIFGIVNRIGANNGGDRFADQPVL